jgi:hypothetical protein
VLGKAMTPSKMIMTFRALVGGPKVGSCVPKGVPCAAHALNKTVPPRLSPTPADAYAPTPYAKSPTQHAQYLLEWLRARGGTRELRFPEMLAAYQRMCDARSLVARPWNPVAAEFTRLTSGQKKYAWFRSTDGSKHRLRVYPIPPISPGVDLADRGASPGAVATSPMDELRDGQCTAA